MKQVENIVKNIANVNPEGAANLFAGIAEGVLKNNITKNQGILLLGTCTLATVAFLAKQLS